MCECELQFEMTEVMQAIKPTNPEVRFLVQHELRHALLLAYSRQGPVSITEFGKDTKFSLWIPNTTSRSAGLRNAVDAQQVPHSLTIEDVFAAM